MIKLHRFLDVDEFDDHSRNQKEIPKIYNNMTQLTGI